MSHNGSLALCLLRHFAKRELSATENVNVTTKFNLTTIAVIAQNEC